MASKTKAGKSKRQPGPKYRQKAWESKLLPPSLENSDGVTEILLRKLSFFTPKMVSRLHQEVLDDYGYIDVRSIYVRLAKFKAAGVVKSIISDEDEPSYLRVGDWMAKDLKVTPDSVWRNSTMKVS